MTSAIRAADRRRPLSEESVSLSCKDLTRSSVSACGLVRWQSLLAWATLPATELSGRLRHRLACTSLLCRRRERGGAPLQQFSLGPSSRTQCVFFYLMSMLSRRDVGLAVSSLQTNSMNSASVAAPPSWNGNATNGNVLQPSSCCGTQVRRPLWSTCKSGKLRDVLGCKRGDLEGSEGGFELLLGHPHTQALGGALELRIAHGPRLQSRGNFSPLGVLKSLD